MSWQDELRQLDEELAAGRLSAEDYRRQRDDLLSKSASTAAPLKSAQQPAQEPASQQEAGSPFPPPFRWDSPPDEATQKITPTRRDTGVEPAPPADDADDDAERTQVVHRPRRPAAEHTEMAQGQQPSFQPQFQQERPGQPEQPGFQPGAPWQPSDEHAPPWGGWDAPQQDQTPAWLRQGPEVFESGGSSRIGKVVVAAVAVVVVTVLGVGAYIVLRPDSGNQPAATDTTGAPNVTSTNPPTTTTAVPTTTAPPPAPIVTPAGSVQVDDTFTLARLRDAKLLSPQDFTIIEENGVRSIQVAVTKQGGMTLGTWAFDADNRQTAAKVLAGIEQLYTGVGFKPVAAVTRANVSALTLTQPGVVVFRAHYLGDGKVIRVEAYGPDAAAAQAAFADLLDQQLARLPARS